MKLILLIFLLLVGCGQEIKSKKVSDPFFDSYKQKFQAETGYIAIHIPIKFVDNINDVTLARCYYTIENSYYNYIIVSKRLWDTKTELQQESIIYHELGHCAMLIYNHVYGNMSNGCPKSIMNTYLMSNYCYEMYRDYYVLELIELANSRN